MVFQRFGGKWIRTSGEKKVLPRLRAQGLRTPRSTRTIWQILRQYGRIADRHREYQPLPRPAPMAMWQLDFKDVSTVPADPEGTRQHVVA